MLEQNIALNNSDKPTTIPSELILNDTHNIKKEIITVIIEGVEI